MNIDRFQNYVYSLRSGCQNRINDHGETEKYYIKQYTKITAKLMSITAQHYNNDEEN